jgi:hypothetical protein
MHAPATCSTRAKTLRQAAVIVASAGFAADKVLLKSDESRWPARPSERRPSSKDDLHDQRGLAQVPDSLRLMFDQVASRPDSA